MTIPEIKENNKTYTDFSLFDKGGMGEIYKGLEKETSVPVILKLIPIVNETDEKLLHTELDVSKSFNHPNVLKTHAIGKMKIDGTTYYYMLQDFYEKGNLRNFIKPNLPFEQSLSMIMDILQGMKEIHKTIVHRDLKPENILENNENHLVIADFGLAKYVGEVTRTNSHKGWGTIPYMAPECWTGDSNTPSMELYALGIICFEIITGKKPFESEDQEKWKEWHLFSTMPNIASFRPDISTKVDQIIQKMTKKRRNERYTNIDEIITALTEAVKIQKDEQDQAERLAALGNISLQRSYQQQLVQERKQKEKNEYNDKLQFHIKELLSEFKKLSKNINSRLENEKIKIIENPSSDLCLSFNGKTIEVSFSSFSKIKSYNDRYRSMAIEFQRSCYGMVMGGVEDCELVKNNIVLFGLAETGHKIGEREYGFNVALMLKPSELYGTWYKIAFSENINTIDNHSFGLDISIFAEKYEEMKHSMFNTCSFSPLTDKDLTDLIEKIMI